MLLCAQVPMDELKEGDVFWSIHDQEWCVISKIDDNPYEITIHYSFGSITAEPEHLVFRRFRATQV